MWSTGAGWGTRWRACQVMCRRSRALCSELRARRSRRWLRGQTLSHLIETSGPLVPAEAAVLGLQLLSAVGYLHGRGYLHLDLKPSNIIADGGRAITIDLSIARRPGRAPAGLGTWCYLAPEQARGGHVCDAADVWGVGAVLFEALTSKPPFDDSRVTSDLSLDAAEPELYPQLTGRAARLSGRVRARPSLSP